MTLSMTGFSSLTFIVPYPQDEQKESRVHITMTLKSLNARFFEVNCKLPHSLTQLETQVIKLFKSKLLRGNIYFTLHMTNPNALVSSVDPSLSIIASYLRAIEHIQAQYPITGALSVSDLLHLPHIFSSHEEPLSQEIIDFIMGHIHALVGTLEQARLLEGQALENDIRQRIAVIKKYLLELEPRAELVMTQKKEQLFETLRTVLPEGESVPTETHNVALYNQLDKLDIHEEIIRFKAHLENLSAILSEPAHEKGKKIDFTLQELFREINTMTSKGSDALISSLAINIKVELEKAREQAQNIV